jgi:predicted HTH domain antitoxin
VFEVTLSISEESLSGLHVPTQQAAEELRMLAAVKLFELHRLSSGAAASLAGVPRTAFLQRLGDYGVSVLDLTEEELGLETRLV